MTEIRAKLGESGRLFIPAADESKIILASFSSALMLSYWFLSFPSTTTRCVSPTLNHNLRAADSKARLILQHTQEIIL